MPRIAAPTALAAIAASAAIAAAEPAPPVGLRPNVVFTQATPLSSNPELARRMLTPLTAATIPRALAKLGKALSEQPVDVTREHFVLYAPAKAPPGGYGLLVFVAPWREARLPQGWAAGLDRHGMIFVSAAESGNDASPLGRRDPLALIGAEGAMRLYPVDPEKVYVGGFSGGSRIAMRLALAYPDVFRGALLNAGGDPIGESRAPIPPADLFARFQSSRLVYVTGEKDTANLAADGGSRESMRQWCVYDITSQVIPLVGHIEPDASAFGRALDALIAPARPDAAKLAACRAHIEKDLGARLGRVEAQIAAGRPADARRLLEATDRRYGGLAAPRSLELAERIRNAGGG